MTELKDQRISDALFLLSRDNYWDAIKIVYDVLMNEAFRYATTNARKKQFEIEESGKDILCLLYDYLKSQDVVNIEPILSEIRLLTIFFNNFSREALPSNIKNYKVKVLTMNLIGLLKFISQNEKAGYRYHFGMIDSELINEIQNNVAEELYEATDPYFELFIQSKEVFNHNFWEDLEDFDPLIYPLSIFEDAEYELLFEYRKLMNEHQLALNQTDRERVQNIWKSELDQEHVYQKMQAQYHVLHLYKELDDFRKADKSSGKYDKNVYRTEKEAAFHKNIYPSLCNKNYDLVLSELSSGNQRYDILLYQENISFSAILELKVNGLEKADENLQQLINYLDEVGDKPHHYIIPPNIGALLVYYIGEKKLAEIDLVKKLDRFPMVLPIDKNFYLVKSDDSRDIPILIGLFNGKE